MATKPFHFSIDLIGNALIRALMDPRTTDPTGVQNGQVWYRTDLHELRARINGATVALGQPTVYTAGDGLTLTGGDFDINAGAGLTFSGDDLVVGAGTGILSNANDVAVDTSVIATKAYADSVAQGLDVKNSVMWATAAALPAHTYNSGAGTLTASANAALTIDSNGVTAGDRVLVKNETNQFEQGIYVVTQAGSAGTPWILTRAADANTGAELTPGTFVWVERGLTNADSGWVVSSDTPVPNLTSDPIFWSQFSGAGQITAGGGIGKTGNTLFVSAGSGLTQDTDGLSIDPLTTVLNTYVRASSTTITGDGSTTQFDINHALGHRRIKATLVENFGSYRTIDHYEERPSTSVIRIIFSPAPAVGENYTVLLDAYPL